MQLCCSPGRFTGREYPKEIFWLRPEETPRRKEAGGSPQGHCMFGAKRRQKRKPSISCQWVAEDSAKGIDL